jgi:hypothetical protein
MHRHLEALRQDPETDYAAEAQLTLHQEAERRHKERLRQREESWRKERSQQQAAADDSTSAGREPATDRDPGWEF